MEMAGRLLTDQWEIRLRASVELQRLFYWRNSRNLTHPPGCLWWDERDSFYRGRFTGWKCCSVCGPRDGGPETDKLVMDHCHRTGLYRGLLCIQCNLSEGKSSQTWWFLWRIAAPGLSPSRRVIHSFEPNTQYFDADDLLNAPMTHLLRKSNQINIQNGRLTDVLYI